MKLFSGAMLDKLDGRTPATPVLPPNTNLDASADGSVNNSQNSQGSSNGSTNGGPTNPIGKLQEYCVKFSLPLPIYDLANTIGQPHQRNFEMCAKVGKIKKCFHEKILISHATQILREINVSKFKVSKTADCQFLKAF